MLNIIKLKQKYIFSGNPARKFPFSSPFILKKVLLRSKMTSLFEPFGAEKGNVYLPACSFERAAHSMPRFMISSASGTSKSLASWQSEE